jgi:hypothetical protein
MMSRAYDATPAVPAQVCAACGLPVVRVAPPLALPPVKERIFQTVAARPGISADALTDFIWSDDINGGPDQGRKCLHVHVHQLNRRLQPLGLRIRGSHAGGYRLVSIQEAAP